MYNRVLRNLFVTAENVCTKFAFCPAQKLAATKRTHVRCIAGYVLPNRMYCTEQKQTENDINPNLSKEQAEEELEIMLSDPEYAKFKKILELEFDILRRDVGRVPDKIKAKAWVQLLKMKTVSRRRRYLSFLWLNEKKSENAEKKKALKKLEKQEKFKDNEQRTGSTRYGLHNNALFLRIYQSTMHTFYNSRIIPSLLFGPKLVFDLGYDQHMSYMENSNCAKQLILSFVANRIHNTPFHFYFCNCNYSGHILQAMHRMMPNIYDDEMPINVTSKSYLDIFDKDKLIYLTPNAKTELTNFDSDMIYIIGALVDKTDPQPLTFAKAKREGLKMAKLPLDSHLFWGAGSGKNLTINQCVSILLDAYQLGDWDAALDHVPKRKLKRTMPEQVHHIQRRNRRRLLTAQMIEDNKMCERTLRNLNRNENTQIYDIKDRRRGDTN